MNLIGSKRQPSHLPLFAHTAYLLCECLPLPAANKRFTIAPHRTRVCPRRETGDGRRERETEHGARGTAVDHRESNAAGLSAESDGEGNRECSWQPPNDEEASLLRPAGQCFSGRVTSQQHQQHHQQKRQQGWVRRGRCAHQRQHRQ